jgi:hypothetical protein
MVEDAKSEHDIHRAVFLKIGRSDITSERGSVEEFLANLTDVILSAVDRRYLGSQIFQCSPQMTVAATHFQNGPTSKGFGFHPIKQDRETVYPGFNMWFALEIPTGPFEPLF